MDISTIILIILGVLFFFGVSVAGSASRYFLETAEKRLNIVFSGGTTASNLARECIRKNNLNISVVKAKYKYGEHYSSKKRYIAISEAFFNSNSLVANGIVAHEIGHAITDSKHNPTFVFHRFLAKLCKLLNYVFYLVLIAFLVFVIAFPELEEVSLGLLYAEIGIVLISLLFKFITIKNEKNASEIGLAILLENGATKEEVKNIKKVYNAALITYVGAIFMPVVRILNFVLDLFYNTIGRLFR